MDVLLTFTGFHDPYFKGLIDQEDQPGPILFLLATRLVRSHFSLRHSEHTVQKWWRPYFPQDSIELD